MRARQVLALAAVPLVVLACRGHSTAPAGSASSRVEGPSILAPGLSADDVRRVVSARGWQLDGCDGAPADGYAGSTCSLHHGKLLAHLYLTSRSDPTHLGPATALVRTRNASLIGVVVQDPETAVKVRDLAFPSDSRKIDGITADQITRPLVADGWTVSSHDIQVTNGSRSITATLKKGDLEADIDVLDEPAPSQDPEREVSGGLATADFGGDTVTVDVFDRAKERDLLAGFGPPDPGQAPVTAGAGASGSAGPAASPRP